MKFIKYCLLLLSLAHSGSLLAHVGEHSNTKSVIYTIKGKQVEGHFLMEREGKVFIEQENGKIISADLNDFSFSNQASLSKKIAFLKQINTENRVVGKFTKNTESTDYQSIYVFLFIGILGFIILMKKQNQNPKMAYFLGSFMLFFYACKTNEAEPTTSTTNTTPTLSKTDPSFIEKVFTPYKSEVKTRFDDTYFYVETEGIPQTHNMMVGITSWQQQVPIPQGYTGSNAWSIPLKPEFAASPLSFKTNFMKGAVAIAPNGIPIFNPLNNRGEDAFAIGELDQWGGHCGRADDYHYHIAPLHFEATAGNNPIAMALDGFAIYGTKEPDGTAMKTLDEYHGHNYSNTYHYHTDTKYPYFMAAMRGKVSLDPSTPAPENQILPQAKSAGVRPALTALKGASITNFKATGTNAYSLEYTLDSKKAYVNYAWDTKGVYTFTFIGIDGKSTTTQYTKK
ncbi:YHYH protein [Emticicia aquatilis]|uniref:YHYH protein n=1 Tax=Emticicia aquatilis TaxID=1537369 RepID=UPI001669B05D|nr:YHYH protein [Emticicia aquatilis]